MTRRKATRDPQARHRTALHEAGHAVISVVLGITVEYASIRPGKSFNAVVVSVHREMPDLDAFGVGGLVEQPPALRAEVERQIIAALAGELAALYLAAAPTAARYGEDADEIARHALEALGPRIADLVKAHEADRDSADDETNAWRIAHALADDFEVTAHYVAWLRGEARLLVSRCAPAILRVADALERSAVLDGEQVAALVRPAKGAPS